MAAPRASAPAAPRANATHAPSVKTPAAPRAGKPAAVPRIQGNVAMHSHAAMPKTHTAMPKARPAAHPHAVTPRQHMPPPAPRHHHVAPRFLHPRGHHIGGRHIVIVPPTVLINDYYWTEEVFIDGYYYILYCYPDGTKRFADGTIYCYF